MDRRERPFSVSFSAMIAVAIIIIIIGAMVLSTRDIYPASVPDRLLLDGWHEDLSAREQYHSFLSLYQSVSYTYVLENASSVVFLVVNTSKALVLPPKDDLMQQAVSTYLDAHAGDYQVSSVPLQKGSRPLANGHRSQYRLYNGSLKGPGDREPVLFLVEVWNCGVSQTSVSCFAMGFEEKDASAWKTIVADPRGTFGESYQSTDGFIYSLRCH